MAAVAAAIEGDRRATARATPSKHRPSMSKSGSTMAVAGANANRMSYNTVGAMNPAYSLFGLRRRKYVRPYEDEEARGERTLEEEVTAVRRRLDDLQGWIIDPKSRFIQRWDGITFAALVFTAIVTPVEVAFTGTKPMRFGVYTGEYPLFARAPRGTRTSRRRRGTRTWTCLRRVAAPPRNATWIVQVAARRRLPSRIVRGGRTRGSVAGAYRAPTLDAAAERDVDLSEATGRRRGSRVGSSADARGRTGV